MLGDVRMELILIMGLLLIIPIFIIVVGVIWFIAILND